MNTKKLYYILFLVGVLLLNGCTKDVDQKNLSIESATQVEVKNSMAGEVVEETKATIQLKQEENSYVLSGISHYFDSLVVPVGEELKLLGKDGAGHLSLNLKELKWEEREKDFSKDFTIVEKIRVGMLQEVPQEQLEKAVLSGKRDKIAIVDGVEKYIKIINFKNNKTTIIDSVDVEEIKKPYHENIVFSPKGGYISIHLIDEKNGEGFVSFGADSGKQVHDLIYGVGASWSHGERSIAFLYRDGDKMGIYKRRSEEIDYLDEISEGKTVFSPLKWSKDDSAVYFTTGKEDATNIHVVKLKDRTVTRIKEEELLKETDFTKISEAHIANNQLLFTLRRQGEVNAIKVVDLKGDGSTIHDNITPFILHEGGREEKVSYHVLGKGILFIKDNSVYLMEGSNTKCILKNKDTIKKIQYLEEEELLVLYIDEMQEQKLIFISLLD